MVGSLKENLGSRTFWDLVGVESWIWAWQSELVGSSKAPTGTSSAQPAHYCHCHMSQSLENIKLSQHLVYSCKLQKMHFTWSKEAVFFVLNLFDALYLTLQLCMFGLMLYFLLSHLIDCEVFDSLICLSIPDLIWKCQSTWTWCGTRWRESYPGITTSGESSHHIYDIYDMSSQSVNSLNQCLLSQCNCWARVT